MSALVLFLSDKTCREYRVDVVEKIAYFLGIESEYDGIEDYDDHFQRFYTNMHKLPLEGCISEEEVEDELTKQKIYEICEVLNNETSLHAEHIIKDGPKLKIEEHIVETYEHFIAIVDFYSKS